MNKQIALKLEEEAEICAAWFSKKDREYNTTGETFEISEIIPLSESTAAVIYLKNTGKKAITFFYYRKDRWIYFFPTDSHILGMEAIGEYKKIVERQNWYKNFEPKEKQWPKEDE